MDRDFATGCPLVRPYLPQIRFLFVGSRFRSTLPSDGPSRFRPCASLVLHLHQVVQGTFTPKLLGMPSTQPGPAGHRRRAAAAGLTRGAPSEVMLSIGCKGRCHRPPERALSGGPWTLRGRRGGVLVGRLAPFR